MKNISLFILSLLIAPVSLCATSLPTDTYLRDSEANIPPSGGLGGLTIESLANDNAIIRVSPDAKEKYLLLPIEEIAPEANIKVIVNNIQQRTLNIRLALTKIDYYVPFNLDEFREAPAANEKGSSLTKLKNLQLFTHVNIDRSNRGGVGSEICFKNIKLSNTFDTTNREKWRPEYHFTPLYGWMNDPNGMFYKDGVWNLYYQYGPYGSMWNNMTWGHAISKDLIHWEHKPEAIRPDANGAIFSGSCIVDKNNTAGFGKDAIIAMYTSAGDVQSQSIAYSLDNGETFHVYEGNPVLTADIPDFRDPNMFWWEPEKVESGKSKVESGKLKAESGKSKVESGKLKAESGRWILVMSAGQEDRIYSSPDMKHWTEESRFGSGLGCHSGVWECPDLFKLKVESGKLKGHECWVMFCNINPGGPAGGSATQYFIGDFDGHNFTVDNLQRYVYGKALWQDYGKDHYATVSFSNAPDGRHTMIAWMSNWQYANQVPTKQFRSANSICREPFLYTGADGQIYLGNHPSPEYDGKGLDKEVKVNGSCTVTLSNDQGEEFKIIYDQTDKTLTVDRSKSGETDFSQDFAAPATAPVRNKLTSMRIFIDNSSVEVFGNNGEVCLTSLCFPKSKYNKVTVTK